MDCFVSTEWLAGRLGTPGLRVIDCTVHLRPMPIVGTCATSGLRDFRKAHVPGAVFADLIKAFSDPDAEYRFTLPSAERFGAAMGRLGVSNDCEIVAYSTGSLHWAARFWWMLKAFGHDRAAVLDGGLAKWRAEGRPVAAGDEAPEPASFRAERREGYFVGEAETRAAMDNPGAVVLNSLSAAQHAGTGGTHYGRPGRIAGSVNVPSQELVDPETGALLPLDEIRRRFEAVGALGAGEVVTYCGGGIAASLGAMVLHRLGQENVAVYDDSLQAWVRDEALPMETG